jgi:HK97 family phage major capsid protein
VNSIYDRAVDDIAALHAERTLRTLQGRGARSDDRWLELCARVDPARIIRNLRSETIEGADREANDELAKRQPIAAGNGARIPWQTLSMLCAPEAWQTRADTVVSLTGGGYLVSTLNFSSAAQSLLPMLVLGKAGISAIDSTANLNYPKIASSATVSWQSTETTQITEVEQTFGQLALSPHTVGGYTEISRLLLLQSSPGATANVARDLMRKVGVTIDGIAISGSGSAGQPHGIIGLTNVNTQSGASYALGTGMAAATATGDALLDSARPGFIANRAVASTLRQKQEFTGGSLTLWRGALTAGTLHDFPAYSTSNIPAGDMVFGNWQHLVLCDFSGGLDVELNPFANFQAGIVGVRAFATIDFGPIWPSAFTAITGIT